MIAECVLNEAQAPGLRADLEARLDVSLIVGVAGGEEGSPAPPVERGKVYLGQAGTSINRGTSAVPIPHQPREKISSTPAEPRNADLLEGHAGTQPFLQLRPPPPTRDVAHRDR